MSFELESIGDGGMSVRVLVCGYLMDDGHFYGRGGIIRARNIARASQGKRKVKSRK